MVAGPRNHERHCRNAVAFASYRGFRSAKGALKLPRKRDSLASPASHKNRMTLIVLFFRWGNPAADLLHKRQKIADTPVVGDLAVLDAHDVHRLEVDLAVSWSDPKKRTFMRAVVRFVPCHPVAIGQLPVDLRMKVRERTTPMPPPPSFSTMR
jgi:hypothetical protein